MWLWRREDTVCNCLFQGLKVLERVGRGIDIANGDENTLHKPLRNHRPLELDGVGGVVDSQVNFHGLKVTRRGLDHHRDVGFYEETRQVNLLLDRKKADFLVKKDPRRRGGEQETGG